MLFLFGSASLNLADLSRSASHLIIIWLMVHQLIEAGGRKDFWGGNVTVLCTVFEKSKITSWSQRPDFQKMPYTKTASAGRQVYWATETWPDFLVRSLQLLVWNMFLNGAGTVRGASKIKLKKVNKKRTVTVRRVIIFLNISRHPLLICLQCCLHQYKTLKAVATATAAKVLLTPAKNLKMVFLGFLVVSPLFNHFLG